MANELQKLSARHHKIVDLALAGHGRKTIAQALDITPQAVTMITQAPVFQEELARRRQESRRETDKVEAVDLSLAKAALERGALNAAEKLTRLVDAEDDRVALTASTSVLDRVFQGGPGGAGEGGGGGIILNAENVQVLQIALRETALEDLG